MHANSAAQALNRFTSCVLQSGVDLPYTAIRHGIAECLQLLVHLERRQGRRVVTELVRVRRYDAATDRYDLESLGEVSEVATAREGTSDRASADAHGA